jgi:hypothetical protein
MRYLTLLTLSLLLANCKTVTSDLYTLPNSPVSFQFVSDMVDEETIENTVKFRNSGGQIINFDYTIADDPNVPHTDAEGPNSGVVENLYPGAEISVKNPNKRMKDTYVIVGKISYGRKSADEIVKLYKPAAAKAARATAASSSMPGVLPALEPLSTPAP